MSRMVLRSGRGASTASAPQPAAAVGDAEVQRYAPHLPLELMHAVLRPVRHDIVTLSAAAGVSKSWRAAALHPRYWAKLQAPAYQQCSRSYNRFQKLTDEGLAVLVRRACGSDPDGKQHKLGSLTVSRESRLTLRGVLAALGGPRDDAGAPLLHGALDGLQVAGARTTVDDVEDAGELFPELQSFLRPGSYPGLDVADIAQCTNENCSRLLERYHHGCDDCGIDLCYGCVDRKAVAPCGHICSKCYGSGGDGGLLTCDKCEQRDDKAGGIYCENCSSYCDACDEHVCVDCAEIEAYVYCSGSRCFAHFCEHCAFELENLQMCADCTSCYCSTCVDANLVLIEHEEGSSDDEDSASDDDEPRLLCPDCRGSDADDN